MDELKYVSLDDDDVRHYLPDARILKYNELSKYKTIEQLLPKHKSFVILLIIVGGFIVYIYIAFIYKNGYYKGMQNVQG